MITTFQTPPLFADSNGNISRELPDDWKPERLTDVPAFIYAATDEPRTQAVSVAQWEKLQ